MHAALLSAAWLFGFVGLRRPCLNAVLAAVLNLIKVQKGSKLFSNRFPHKADFTKISM